jgi:hypothetical protein
MDLPQVLIVSTKEGKAKGIAESEFKHFRKLTFSVEILTLVIQLFRIYLN